MTLLFVTATIFLTLALKATAKPSPVAMTERGSAVLVWLKHHERAGTPKSRRYVHRRFRRMVWNGLKLSGTYRPFLCIHHYESGNWFIYNPPYAGGLQMDSGFQASYGPEYLRLWGHAGRWPIWAQMNAAYRAWRTRGYYPWPNTARYCGLI